MTAGQGRRVGLVLAALALAGVATAQERPAAGGTLITFGIRPELRYDDNLDLDPVSPGGSTLLDTRLSFGLRSETRAQTLSLDVSGAWRLAETPGGRRSGLDSPLLSFSYERRGADSLLRLFASYQESDLGLLSDPLLVLDPITGLPILVDPGRRATTSVGLRLETGIERPFGLVLEARRSDVEMLDRPGSLGDSRSDSLSVQARLRFSPVLSGGLRLAASRQQTEDLVDTEQRSRGATASLTYQWDAATRIDASLGYSRVTTDRAVGADSAEEGATASLSLDRRLASGSAGIAYDRSVLASGSRDTLRLSRVLQMPRGELSFSLGATRGDGGEVEGIGRLAYAQELPRGSLTVSLERAVYADEDGNDVLSTRISAGGRQALGALSALSLNLGFARIEDGGAGTTTPSSQADLTLAYERQVTEDWTLGAGYRYRMRDGAGGEAESNSVFVNLGRTFAIRP